MLKRLFRGVVLSLAAVGAYAAVRFFFWPRPAIVFEDENWVVLFGGESDPEVAALGGLLMAVRLLVPVVDQGRRVDARAVKQRGKELLQQYWPAVALQRAVQSREAANAAAASG